MYNLRVWDGNTLRPTTCGTANTEGQVITLGTGLLDSNGTEIYEGDILEYSGVLGVVIFPFWNCYCCGGVYGFTMIPHDVSDLRDYSDSKVVGNIFENPDLLPKVGLSERHISLLEEKYNYDKG